jgi:hypothetical protein
MTAKIQLQNVLNGKWTDGTRPGDVYALVVKPCPGVYVKDVLDGLNSGIRRVENGCAELASLISEDTPEFLLPHISLFVQNLDSSEKMVRWEAVCTLGFLARIDSQKQIVPCISRFVGLLRHDSIVLAGHALRALSRMAVAYPEKTKAIFQAIVGAADAFEKNRIGFVIEAMEPLIATGQLNRKIEQFVQPYSRSDISVVARKAKKVLKLLDQAMH